MSLRIAYLVNQYPKVSHSFIRREILALERRGIDVLRVALRGWDELAPDAQDSAEQEATHYLLARGLPGLLAGMARLLVCAPSAFWRGLRLALSMARQSERGLPYHIAYLAEACCLALLMKSKQVAHVHAHFGTNSAEVAMLAAALTNLPYSFTAHGPEEFDRPLSLGLGEKIRRAAFVVAVSSYGRSQLYRWVEPRFWPKIEVVHCGLEDAFHAVAPLPPPAAPRLVCVGRLCEQKGQLLLVEAVHRLRARGLLCEIVLAGDGEMRAEIEAAVREYALGDSLRITGWIDGAQVRAEILQARALVLPSFAEGLPVVIMEAMALRRPVLSTYVAGIPELVRQGVDGWLVPAGDVAALAEAMQACLEAPPAQLAAMGEAAHRRVVERHAIDVEAVKLDALFRKHAVAQQQDASSC